MPLLLTIVGFHASRKSVLAMVAGFIVVLAGNIFEVKADTILIGMLINMIVFFGFIIYLSRMGVGSGLKTIVILKVIRRKKPDDRCFGKEYSGF